MECYHLIASSVVLVTLSGTYDGTTEDKFCNFFCCRSDASISFCSKKYSRKAMSYRIYNTCLHFGCSAEQYHT